MYKKIIAFVLIIVLTLTLLILPACRKKPETGTISAEFVGATLHWDAYDGASRYAVSCILSDGTGYTIKTEDTSYTSPYKNAGDYTYYVKALAQDGSLLAFSEPVLLHIGKGNEGDPIEIATADELLAITGKTKVAFGEQSVSAPLYYRMTRDIDLSGKSITPIGNSSNPFIGVFDGDGHTISGISFTKSNADGNIGLFGAIKNAVVKNLTIKDASILFDKDSEVKKSSLNYGLMIGISTASLVDNCHVTGNVDVLSKVITTDNNVLSAGGIIGKVDGGKISGCSFKGSVAAQYGIAYTGGIIGFAQGETPDFMLLNSIADATISAVGTAYNVTTGTSYAYARAGVLIGNISHAGRLASLIALGTAKATTTRSGTSTSSLTSGVFGRVNSSVSSTSNTPMYHIYYSESIEKPVGNVSSLGNYENYVYRMSDAALRDKESYRATSGYGLNFDEYWTIAEGEIPSLRKVSTLPTSPDLDITVRSEIPGKTFSYDFSIKETFLPTYFDLGLGTTVRAVGYNVATLFGSDALNIALTDKQRVKFSADGVEDLVVTVSSKTIRCYLMYGAYTSYEEPASTFGGYKIVDLASLKTYDFAGAKHLTITILPEEAEA